MIRTDSTSHPMVLSWMQSWHKMRFIRDVELKYEDTCDQCIWNNNNIVDRHKNTIDRNSPPFKALSGNVLYHVGQLFTNYNVDYVNNPIVGIGRIKTPHELKREFPCDATITNWRDLIKCIPYTWKDTISKGNTKYDHDDWIGTMISYVMYIK